MEDRVKFITNGIKSGTEAGANKLRVLNSLINSVDMPADTKKEFKAIMKDLENGISRQSSVKIQAVNGRVDPLVKAWGKKVAEDKAKNKSK